MNDSIKYAITIVSCLAATLLVVYGITSESRIDQLESRLSSPSPKPIWIQCDDGMMLIQNYEIPAVCSSMKTYALSEVLVKDGKFYVYQRFYTPQPTSTTTLVEIGGEKDNKHQNQ